MPELSEGDRVAEDLVLVRPLISGGMGSVWVADHLALHTQVVLQGAFVVAKAHGDARVATDAIDHLRRYFELLFPIPRTHSKSKSKNKRKKKSR